MFLFHFLTLNMAKAFPASNLGTYPYSESNVYSFTSEKEDGLGNKRIHNRFGVRTWSYILSKALSSMFVKLHLLIITVYVDRKVDNKVK